MSADDVLFDLHKFHFIPPDWRARKCFRHPSQCMPSCNWYWNQFGLNAGFVCNNSQEFLVGVDARATALEHNWAGLRERAAWAPHIFAVGLSHHVQA
jgi:hypothetical protein